MAYRLPPGVTGFLGSGADQVPRVDLKLLRGALYAAARAADGHIGAFVEQSYAGTFHTATIERRRGSQVILCHVHYPLIAFVACHWDYDATEYRDPPAWADGFADAGFEVLTAGLLASPLEEVDTSGLSATEWREIKYWRPTSVGAVLFNCWD